MAAAVEWARRGRAVEVLEDDAAWGRAARALDDPTRPSAERWEPLLTAFEGAVRTGVTLRLRTTAVAIYGDDLLCASPEGVEVLEARTLVLAPGAHDGVLPFEGNDLPGILSARAGCLLLGCGVRPGKRVVVAATHEASSFADAYARMDPSAAVVRGAPTRARGSRRIKAVTFAVAGDDRPRDLPCDALILDAPRAPAYELCAAAGAELTRTPTGYLVRTAPGSTIRPAVLVVGEAAGTPLEPRAVLAEAAAMAE
jgi:sarcosine oxidase subunit alpha